MLLLPLPRRRKSSAVRRNCPRSTLNALLRPPMSAIADAMEVVAAVDQRAAAVEVHADLVPRATLRAPRPHVGEWRQPREMDGCGVLHRAALPVTRYARKHAIGSRCRMCGSCDASHDSAPTPCDAGALDRSGYFFCMRARKETSAVLVDAFEITFPTMLSGWLMNIPGLAVSAASRSIHQ